MKNLILTLLVATSFSPLAFSVSDHEKAVKANNKFGFNFYQAIRKDEKKRVQNRFVSPISAYYALSMLANGAANTTEDAIYRTMATYGMSREELNRSGKDLLTLLNKQMDSKNPTKIEIANSVWTDESFRFRDSYVDTLKSVYSAEARTMDFNSAEAPKTINQWVSDKTYGKIKDVVGKSLEEDFYLINTTYFKAPWQHPFDEKNTKKAAFALPDGKSTQVDMMNGHHFGRYAKTKTYEAAEIRYGAYGEASLLVLLPQGNLSDLEEALTEETFQEVEALLEPTSAEHSITLSLPKFQFEYGTNLQAPLTDMGMGIAFKPFADFRDMAAGVYVSKALQKTYLGMNEIGTEAAAATVIAGTTSAPMYPKVALKLDKPFAIAIRDNRSRAILFLGTVVDPS